MSESNKSNIIRGDEALALGALNAGVGYVSGYPGSPATGVFDSILANSESAAVNIRWSANEMVAAEMCWGACLAGTRSLLVVKSVGMNVALDPLATFSLSGNHAGMVILLGDDPGAWSSQNEQDSRWTARTAEIPVIEPTNVADASAMMTQAFAWSEAIGLPVIVRVTRALTLATGEVGEGWKLPMIRRTFFYKRNRWVVLPYIVNRRHRTQHDRLRRYQASFEASPYDYATGMENGATAGVLAVGYAHTKMAELLGDQLDALRTLALSSVWPLPEEALASWLGGLDRVLVLEEGGPFVEEQLQALAQRRGLSVAISGRHDRAIPEEGELGATEIAAGLASALGITVATEVETQHPMPSTVQLCDDCPYRPVFDALIDAMDAHGGRKRHIVVGETGCMVRANLEPMELFDVKYGLGSGLGLAMGLAESTSNHKVVALLGDSSFFHSDIPAMPQVAQHRPPMTVIVLDNDTTALTGGQAHPGSTLDERGEPRAQRADLAAVIRGCGAEAQDMTISDDLPGVINEALAADDLRVIVVRGPCPRYVTPKPSTPEEDKLGLSFPARSRHSPGLYPVRKQRQIS